MGGKQVSEDFKSKSNQIVRPVYDKLLDTFLGKPDKAWWNDIVLRQAKVAISPS